METGTGGKAETISIRNVRREGNAIKVTYKTLPESTPREGSIQRGQTSALPMTLSGLCLGVLVVLTRRKRAGASRGSRRLTGI